VIHEYAAVVCKCIAEFGLLLELTVPVGVGNTNGVVGVVDVDVDVDVDVEVDERLTVTVPMDDIALRAIISGGGIGFVAVSDGTGDAKVPVIEIRLFWKLGVVSFGLGGEFLMINNRERRKGLSICGEVVNP